MAGIMTDNWNNTGSAALDMENNTSAIHTAVWDPTEPSATRPLLLQTPSGWYTCGFDQMKNVTELFGASGNIAASYDYAPFGATLSVTGPAAALNPFRFSSEAWDATLGLVYYNWRHYNPFDGHFISRNPIGEDGGLNLYGFVGNDPVNRWDYLGNAYFALRPLAGWPWLPVGSHNPYCGIACFCRSECIPPGSNREKATKMTKGLND
jgi:RHS repeat-associated protein